MLQRIARFARRLGAKRDTTWFPYVLSFVAVLAAALLHVIAALIFGAKSAFPFAFFYLLAAFSAAWLGGPIAGTLSCVLTMVGVPWALSREFRLSMVEPMRLLTFIGVSLLVSGFARSQRSMQQRLREANQELDTRVELRTAELARTVGLLRTEVDERKKTERALRESEQRVDLTLDVAAIGRWDLDLTTGSVARSLRHDQIFGYEAMLDAWSYERLLEHTLEEDRASLEKAFEAALGGGDSIELDIRIVRPDGEIRWVWLQGKVLGDEAGAATSILGSVRDITRRKLTEAKLRSQLARLHLLAHVTRGIGERQDLRSIFQVAVRSLEDNLPIDFGCICFYDPVNASLRVTCVGVRSEHLARELAMTEHATIPVDTNGLSQCVRGKLVYEPDAAELDFPFPQRIARGGLHALVAAPLAVGNEVFGVLIAARKQAHSFESGDCEFLRQLSEHVALAANQAQIRAALQDAYDELRKSQQTVMQQERLRALGQMASDIAHDINNAISPVALYTEALLENEPNLSARARQYLETTHRAVEDVAETVARMREFYRQQEPQLVLAPVNVGTLVKQVLDLTKVRYTDMAQRRGATIRASADVALDLPAVQGIESEIREAFTNLILNAVDAMPGGGELTVRAKFVLAGLTTPQVHVEVSDTGAGMDEDTRRRCLEPFFTTKGERGTGLGLAMVYGIAQRHNAEIEIDSAVGKGTTVRLVFPAPETVHAEPERRPEPDRARPQLRILVVDDDPLLIESLRDILEGDGHAVVDANGGSEGIRAFQSAFDRGELFSVVITDLGMPDTDGRKVASAIKSVSSSTPIILLTGWGQRLVAEGDVPDDVDVVLSKPPKLRDLRAALAGCAAGAASSIGMETSYDHK